MIINETGVLLAEIESLFSNFKPQDKKRTVVSWTEVLKHTSLEDARIALKFYMREGHEFAPNPGQLLKIIDEKKPKPYPDKHKAVEILRSALRNATYGAEEEFDALPKSLKIAVGSPSELRRLSQNGFDGYEEHSFLQKYNEVTDRIDKQEIGRRLEISKQEKLKAIETR